MKAKTKRALTDTLAKTGVALISIIGVPCGIVAALCMAGIDAIYDAVNGVEREDRV